MLLQHPRTRNEQRAGKTNEPLHCLVPVPGLCWAALRGRRGAAASLHCHNSCDRKAVCCSRACSFLVGTRQWRACSTIVFKSRLCEAAAWPPGLARTAVGTAETVWGHPRLAQNFKIGCARDKNSRSIRQQLFFTTAATQLRSLPHIGRQADCHTAMPLDMAGCH